MQRAFVRSGFAAIAALLVSLGARTSSAQSFYEAGKISVALERAFGFHYTHQSYDRDNGPETDVNATAVGVLWYGALTPYHYTRAAVDGFIMDRLSIGGSIAFYAHSGDADDDGFLFAPRVGYAIPLGGKMFTFWPRGGVTFWDQGNRSLFGLSLEGMFVFNPNPHWGVLFGPTIDWGFIGGAGDNIDFSEFSLAIPSVGLLATF